MTKPLTLLSLVASVASAWALTSCSSGAGTGPLGGSGGRSSTGGSNASGGASSGGASASGGRDGSGGNGPQATGGSSGSGGMLGTGGGLSATGGSSGTGGRSSTGGASATGGSGIGGMSPGVDAGVDAGVDGPAGSGGSGGAAASTHWVGTWTGAPQLIEAANLPTLALTNTTLRQIAHVSLGGSRIRVRFSNEFGNGPLTIRAAHVAVCKASPADGSIDTATDKALAFSGSASVTIETGKALWSDALDFTLAATSNLSVTSEFGDVPGNVTGHPGSRTTSYQQAGSGSISTANLSSAAQKPEHWYVLSGVDVMATSTAKAIVVLGDSITDGKGSTTNANNRWTDDLAKRLLGNTATANVAIMNQGIGGNAIVTGGLGPTASDRYARDVLGQSGVRWVIVFEGVNDLGADTSVSAITAGFDKMIAQAHGQNLLIYGVTITPFSGNSYYTVDHETARQAVNTYIKSGKFDGVIDFDATVRDTSTPPKLQAAYNSGDGLHLSPAGYQKMADTVDLTLFTK